MPRDATRSPRLPHVADLTVRARISGPVPFEANGLTVGARFEGEYVDAPYEVVLATRAGDRLEVDRDVIATTWVGRRTFVHREIAAGLRVSAPGRYTVSVVSGSTVLASTRIAVGREPDAGGSRLAVFPDRGARLERGDGRATLSRLIIDRWEATDDTPAYRIEWMHGGAATHVEEKRVLREAVARGGCCWTFGQERYLVPEDVLAEPREWSVRVFREGHIGMLVRFGAEDSVTVSAEPWPAELAAHLAAVPRDSREKLDPALAPQRRAAVRSRRVAELLSMPDDWTPDTVYPPAPPKAQLVCVQSPRSVHMLNGPEAGTDVIVIDHNCQPGDPVQAWHPPAREDPKKKHDARVRELADLVAKFGYPWRPDERPSPEDLP